MRSIKRLLDTIVQRLVETHEPERIILFGSYAWGTPDEGSDLDLLIIKQTEKRPLDRRIEARTLLRAIGRPIGLDSLVLTPDELQQRLKLRDPFYEDILSRGKTLYESKRLSGVS